MEEDENYIRRTTYGTPENIRIRRFYNRLNNRPLNYGMEDLFPNVESYTSQPMTSIAPLNGPQQQISGFTPDFRPEVKLSDLQPKVDFHHLGNNLYNEFNTGSNYVKLGAENFFDKISNGLYAKYNPDYKNRKNNYYNQFTPELRNIAIKADELADNVVDIINWKTTAQDLFSKNFTQSNLTKNEEISDAINEMQLNIPNIYQPTSPNIMDTIQKILYLYNYYPAPEII